MSGGARGSGLWGARRGGHESRDRIVKRGLLVLLALALATPLAASAGSGGPGSSWRQSYLAPSLVRAATDTPEASVDVIVQSQGGTANAHKMLDLYGTATGKLDIVGATVGEITAGELPELAQKPGLVITPDHPVALDAATHQEPLGSDEPWAKATGVDQLWPLSNSRPKKHGPPRVGSTPSIAFVDSGIEAGRADFGDRILANVNLSSLPGNAAGDSFGHGTAVAGLAAGSAPHYAGAAPTAGIVALDVMDDNGMARTSDVIAAAEWILRNRNHYDIRVANFSLHSTTESSFRWDPLDKAVEKLWFGGVVVVASAGNDAVDGKQAAMGFAPANDPFVVTVGALDLPRDGMPERTIVPSWSSWGYTHDGFAKPELSAPGRALTAPVPSGSTLATANQLQKQVKHTPGGTYMTLSGTSLSAPIVSGIAADLLGLNPSLSPDRVKGALMLSALPLRKVRTLAAGVGEVNAPGAALTLLPPNPNRALDAFLAKAPGDPGIAFDDQAWVAAVTASPAWDQVSWSDGWNGAAWSVVSWSDVSWSDVSWSDVSWSDVSWSDVSWSSVFPVYSDVG
jgi:serine protease AprX